MDKYIVEIDGKNICSDSDGKSKLALSVKADNGYAVFCTEIPLTPYAEPDMEQVRKEAYEQGYTDGRKKHEVEVYAIAYTNGKQDGYQKGLNEAWDAARKIADIPYGEEEKVLGSDGWTFIANHTAQEAIEEIQQYEQEKDRQARIEYNFDEIKDVIETTAKEYNMSFDEIAEVLKKMGEH